MTLSLLSLRRGWLWVLVGAATLTPAAFALVPGSPRETAAGPSKPLVARDSVTFGAGAAQLRYVELAVASVAAGLAPAPAPARVVVDEGRASPIVAPLAGWIEDVRTQVGQRVRAGERLVALRSAALPELRRELDLAHAAVAVKTRQLDRVRALVELEVLPQKDLLAAQQEETEARIALRSAEGKRRSLRLDTLDGDGRYWLVAPRSGVIVEQRAMIGMQAGPDRAEPLLVIADLAEVMVIADLHGQDVAGIAPGQKARVQPARAEDGALEGVVTHVGEVVDALRRTVPVRIRVKNDGQRLRPNAFARVHLAPPTTALVTIEADAVVQNEGGAVVFVHSTDDKGVARFEPRRVRTGRTGDGRIEILAGLEAGESYAARGALLLLNAISLGS